MSTPSHEDNRYRSHDLREKRIRTESAVSGSTNNNNNNNDSFAQEKIARIIATYARAKDDYYEAEESDLTSHARFLRDTAENAVSYLHKSGFTDHYLIPELEEVFQIARDKASELSGGRKRRFEVDSDGRRGKQYRRLEADDEDRRRKTSYQKQHRRCLDSYRP